MDVAPWTLSELVEEAAAALERVPAPDNGQIRAVPDERGLRYYTTLGLLDRPGAMRGRTALYGKRHLAQVVAIKRMQTAGKTLAEIQQLLATIDDATLARLSGVALPKSAAKRPAAREAFWRGAPAAPPTPTLQPGTPTPTPAPHAPPAMVLRLSLATGVDLLIDAPPGATLDLTAIEAAAHTLLTELTRQGLVPEGESE